jgi:hypothetical protein
VIHSDTPTQDRSEQFEVDPGGDVDLSLSHIPFGLVSFYAEHFAEECSAVTEDSLPTWLGGPVEEVVEPGHVLSLVIPMYRPGSANIDLVYHGNCDAPNWQDYLPHLDYCELSGLEFSGLDLTGVSFNFANLRGASFDAVTLNDADFEGADLRNADFGSVSLSYVNFSDANLGGATLTSVSAASHIDFAGANLEGARMQIGLFESMPPPLSNIHYEDTVCPDGELSVTTTTPTFGTFEHCGGHFEPAGPNCSDGILNNGETEVDCGGPDCGPCLPLEVMLIEAEAYSRALDTTAGNSGGGACDNGDDVDLEATADPTGGSCNVGWTEPGEYLEYDFTLPDAGVYDIVVRLASANAGATELVQIGAQSQALTAPALGWQAWEDRTFSGVTLGSGAHTLRLSTSTGGVNVNYFRLVRTE